MGSGSLRNLAVGAGLDRMNQVGKLDGILDEENRHIISHDVVVSLISVTIESAKNSHYLESLQSRSIAMNITRSISASSRSSNR